MHLYAKCYCWCIDNNFITIMLYKYGRKRLRTQSIKKLPRGSSLKSDDFPLQEIRFLMDVFLFLGGRCSFLCGIFLG